MKRCCVGGCMNTYSSGVSFHKFPKDEELRKKWIAEVQRTRIENKNMNWIPGPGAYVCSQYFEEICFHACVKLWEEHFVFGEKLKFIFCLRLTICSAEANSLNHDMHIKMSESKSSFYTV